MEEPAFARRLLRRRWGGEEPAMVRVLFGADWNPPEGCRHFVAVRSKSWVPDEIDWRCLTDVRVVVEDRSAPVRMLDDWPLSVWVAAEIADHAAVVFIVSPWLYPDDPTGQHDIRNVVEWHIEQHHQPPSWWPRSRALTHEQRRNRFLERERVRRQWAPIFPAGVRG